MNQLDGIFGSRPYLSENILLSISWSRLQTPVEVKLYENLLNNLLPVVLAKVLGRWWKCKQFNFAQMRAPQEEFRISANSPSKGSIFNSNKQKTSSQICKLEVKFTYHCHFCNHPNKDVSHVGWNVIPRWSMNVQKPKHQVPNILKYQINIARIAKLPYLKSEL